MNFELATRVDKCALEDLSVDEMPAVETSACIPAAATPATVTATASVEDPAWLAAPTGYQLSLCWCG